MRNKTCGTLLGDAIYAFILYALTLILASCLQRSPNAPAASPARRTSNLFAHGSGFLGYRKFVIGNPAFYHGRLFVESDRGLYEVVDRKLSARFNWLDEDDVIEELFHDSVHDYLWLRSVRTGKFVYFDGKDWNFAPLPTALGTRGEQLRGFEMFNSGSQFLVASASAIWRWEDPTGRWSPIELPSLNCSGQHTEKAQLCFAGAAANDRSLFVVVSRIPGGLRFGPEFENPNEGNTDMLMYLEDGSWRPVLPPDRTFFFVKEIISGRDAVHVLTTSNELFSATAKGLAGIPSPGEIDKIAKASNGNLLANVKNVGILEFTTRWEKRSDAMPTGPGMIVQMAEDSGQLAYSVSYTDRGLKDECRFHPEASIWLITNGIRSCVRAE